MAEVPFTYLDDYIIENITLAEQDKLADATGLDGADLFIEGVLNDTAVYSLPTDYVADDGETYKYLVLGYVYATPNSNSLYAQYTNHDYVYDKWEESQLAQEVQYEEK